MKVNTKPLNVMKRGLLYLIHNILDKGYNTDVRSITEKSETTILARIALYWFYAFICTTKTFRNTTLTIFVVEASEAVEIKSSCSHVPLRRVQTCVGSIYVNGRWFSTMKLHLAAFISRV